ncbi:N-glycosylase DNA lyase [Micractinium conductrix]|uniref:DNA-(apurinic or apyrimidinic site) lyase n=1 Tax=Micractinium conductrix TaxID=554055 RepID=A0A2P6VAZ9_9CHLO|nr:N-glycosylase DNA lyase [Micractinium conductrix]|eukprot:PSC71264.1 N-glycosylase DNA lyase [Micractinium conductrix]
MAAAMKQEEGGAMDGQPSLTWRSLGTPASELRLEWTLPTGQSFRWRQTGSEPIEFTGMVGQRAVRLRQLADDVQYLVIARGAITQAASLPASGAGSAAATVEHPAAAEAAADAAALRDYFNLGTSLAELAPGWCAACDRFAAVHPLLPGARMLRQDPVECLVQFVCSSNNHISRIGGMVERLCRNYGTRLHLLPGAAAEGGVQEGEEPGGKGEAVAAGAGGKPAPPLELFAFPTLEQLAAASEEALRADGYGYRAKFITGSVAALLAKPQGGDAWLRGLRDVPFEEAAEALTTLPGIGPKVAACICLFSLDKHEAIPGKQAGSARP